MKEFLPK